MGQLWLELWYEPVKPGSCWVVVAASTIPVDGGVQWELIRDVVVQVIWPQRSPSGACSAMATPSAKMRLQQLFEAYDTSGDGDCVCENLQVFHPNL